MNKEFKLKPEDLKKVHRVYQEQVKKWLSHNYIVGGKQQ